MIKAPRNLSLALLSVILFLIPLSGCNIGSNKNTLPPVSSAGADSSAVVSSPDVVSSSTVSDGTAWKNITGKVQLAKAADDWKLIETEPLDENSQYLTYSIDVPDTWAFINEQSSADSAEATNDYRVLNIGNVSVAMIHPSFYIPEGIKLPDNYIELHNEDEEGKLPIKLRDIKIGELLGAIAKQEGTYFAEDTSTNKNFEFYSCYLTDGKAVFNMTFFINDDTIDFVNEELCDKIIGSVQFSK